MQCINAVILIILFFKVSCSTYKFYMFVHNNQI
jgi:hypothetical protein